MKPKDNVQLRDLLYKIDDLEANLQGTRNYADDLIVERDELQLAVRDLNSDLVRAHKTNASLHRRAQALEGTHEAYARLVASHEKDRAHWQGVYRERYERWDRIERDRLENMNKRYLRVPELVVRLADFLLRNK